ncbi:hypothetical protein CNR34_00151 [Pseudomonas phage nickie]|uniref:Uncharacterized protein n=1 Tax=Pseudomonas phage nickie TaxID=2048977 RepID=A0A2H4P7B4_9CAUD|nr:hypothetical protein FDJ16_gp014 [Pseudomonas phage nickie]ATW58084.1 hypothetical protein CNR34_00151 [Pseudomonas phage nickie]
MKGNEEIGNTIAATLSNQALLDKMVDFELDAIKTGAALMTDCYRDPDDETKWRNKKMHALFRLWQAGARYGQDKLQTTKGK